MIIVAMIFIEPVRPLLIGRLYQTSPKIFYRIYTSPRPSHVEFHGTPFVGAEIRIRLIA
jgi:hypothetical protein